MLTTELMKFQNDLNKLLKDSSTKAATEAFIKSLETSSKKEVKEESDFDKIKKDNAEEFGKTFGKIFSQEISSDLAKLIMNFIKSADINIIYTPTTLISPTGPVTGVLTITPQTGTISIL